MAEVVSRDGTRLHVEVEGDGEPVTVFAHGLTNSCMELAAFTPMSKPHVTEIVDAHLDVDAEAVAFDALDEAARRLPAT